MSLRQLPLVNGDNEWEPKVKHVIRTSTNHGTAYDSFPNYNKAVKAFQKYGCGMFDADPDDLDSASKCSNPVINPQLAAIAGALQELSDYPDEWMDAEQYL